MGRGATRQRGRHVRPLRRQVGARPAAALAALALLASCGTWSLGAGPDDTALTTSLEPVAAAWVAAETARHSFPSADPVPHHGRAPVSRLGPGRFVVHYARTPPDGYRVAIDGRLAPPSGLRGNPPFSLDGARFHPAATPTRAALWAPDRLAILIEPAGAGARLVVRQSGNNRDHPLVARLRGALQLAEAVDETGRLLRAGRHAQVRPAVIQARPGGASGNAEPHALLRARLDFHLALVQLADGELVAARRSIARALADDPECHPARVLRVRLDARSARERHLEFHLRLLASLPARPETAHAAGRQALLARRRREAADRPRSLREHAVAWLRHGDPLAAHHWVERARSVGAAGAETLQVVAEVLRHRGLHRQARDTALLELALHGARPELVLALHDDCIALGQVEAGLRWLARYWGELRGPARREARRRVKDDVARTGAELAIRVLLSEHTDPHELADVLGLEGAAAPLEGPSAPPKPRVPTAGPGN